MDAYVIYANSRTCQYQRTLLHVCMQQGIKFTVVCHIISFFWYSDLILHRHTAIAGANKVTCPEIYINTTSSVFTAATCIRDPQQIAFVMLKGFYLLSNVSPPLPLFLTNNIKIAGIPTKIKSNIRKCLLYIIFQILRYPCEKL